MDFKNEYNKLGDYQHLDWIYNRMVNVHGENPLMDYMLKFREIIEKRIEQYVICYDYMDGMWMYNRMMTQFVQYNNVDGELVGDKGILEDCLWKGDIGNDLKDLLKEQAEKQDLNWSTMHIFKRYKDGKVCPIQMI